MCFLGRGDSVTAERYCDKHERLRNAIRRKDDLVFYSKVASFCTIMPPPIMPIGHVTG